MHHDAFFYAQPFLYSVCISVAVCFVVVAISKRYRIDDRRGGRRHIHTKSISRFGGVAIIGAFILSLYFNTALVFDNIAWAMIIGGVMILLFGVFDDIKPLSWKSQLFFQTALVLFVFIFGIQITYITNPFGGVFDLIVAGMPIISLLFMIAWMVFIMNAINWCDGIDGLSGGVVFIAVITLFIMSLQPQVMQPPMAIISIILAGSVLGFLIFNFPPARIFAGSSGAFFMGYIIALLAIAAGAKIGTTLLVLAVPLVDALWVVSNRAYKGKLIFHPDREHLHHRLLDRGWSVTEILFLYYSITALCAFFAIATQSVSKLYTFVGFCILIVVFFIAISYDKKTKFFT